jgi:hypothetical protein
MAEVLLAFDAPVSDDSGEYHARVVGRRADDGMWEGWLEFDRLDGAAETIVGPVESRQPQREHLTYWASGLTPVYLDGALHRARTPVIVRTRVVEEPASDEPAPRTVVVRTPSRTSRRDAVLDPFAVAGQSGLEVLEQELHALHRSRLLDVIAEYDLNPTREDIDWMNDGQLVRFIVVAVEAQVLNRKT